MGIFLEILEHFDNTGQEMVARIPAEGSADIKMGAQLIVQESQVAIFFRDGKALDTFGPGRYSLSTQNVPILTKLLSLPYGFASPFQSSVYFLSTKVFTDLKWGTKEPIAFRDKELSIVRLRAFGKYAMRIDDPKVFLTELVGTKGYASTASVDSYLKDMIVQRLNDLLGENLKTILDLASQYDAIATAVRARVQDSFKKYGLELTEFIISAITAPEEVQKMMDERAKMAVVGDMGRYTQYKVAQSVPAMAAGGGGGLGGAAANLGMGIAMAGAMGQQVSGAVGAMSGRACPSCGQMVPQTAGFCPGCGKSMAAAAMASCPACGKPVAAGAKFCPECGKAMHASITCPGCQKTVAAGKFCPECGKALP